MKMTSLRKKQVGAAVKYLIIGGTSLAIDAGLLFLLTEYLHINYLISGSISFWVALIFNFLSNKLWTFENKEKGYSGQFAKYMILVGFNFLFTLAFMFVFTTIFGIYYVISKLIIVMLMTIWNFIIYKNIIFINKDMAKAGKSK